MQQALKRRVDMAKASRKALDIELIALDRQLQSYEPLDALEIHLAGVKRCMPPSSKPSNNCRLWKISDASW